MIATASDSSRPLRRMMYALLAAISVGGMTGRILALNSVDREQLDRHLKKEFVDGKRKSFTSEQRPFLSANDRSRWCTVRSLVEHGTYAIDKVIEEPNWDTIDMVRHDGKLYSSKPPLLSTIVAAPYWLAHKITGLCCEEPWTLGTHPYEMGRILLLLIQVLPLALSWLALAGLVERFGHSDFGRIFVMATATLGTQLVTFAVTFNNHLFAAICATLALAAAVRLWFDEERPLWRFAVAGFCGAMVGAFELPGLAFAGFLGLALVWRFPARTLLAAAPAALLVAAAFFGTNYLATGGWRVPYSHRGDGKQLALVLDKGGRADALDKGELPRDVRTELERVGQKLPAKVEVRLVEKGQRWSIVADENRDDQMFAVKLVDGGLSIHAWDNWYDYQYTRLGKKRTSYWRAKADRSPVDRGEPSRWRYAYHFFLGHHGLFSLTPVWLLTVAGIVIAIRRKEEPLWPVAVLTAVTSLLVFCFYMAEGEENRNYGGTTSGLRWLFWFTPLWLVTMLPVADLAAGRRWLRWVSYALLSWSMISVAYPTWNPWRHPWLVNVYDYLGWSELLPKQ